MKYFELYDEGTIYHHELPDGLWDIFSPLIYHKGAYVLHMLRGVLGDSVFFECLRQYANHPDLMYQHATTDDFQTVCENLSGVNLDFSSINGFMTNIIQSMHTASILLTQR
ncbi:hypothetical protein JXJ21_24175 [candidate division KSB1 bacterium]|nr:hypothetical protein [candidate division KSB1 bacterium]